VSLNHRRIHNFQCRTVILRSWQRTAITF